MARVIVPPVGSRTNVVRCGCGSTVVELLKVEPSEGSLRLVFRCDAGHDFGFGFIKNGNEIKIVRK